VAKSCRPRVFMTRMNGKRHFPSSLLCRKGEREFHINFEDFIRDLRERGYSPGAVRSYAAQPSILGAAL